MPATRDRSRASQSASAGAVECVTEDLDCLLVDPNDVEIHGGWAVGIDAHHRQNTPAIRGIPTAGADRAVDAVRLKRAGGADHEDLAGVAPPGANRRRRLGEGCRSKESESGGSKSSNSCLALHVRKH